MEKMGPVVIAVKNQLAGKVNCLTERGGYGLAVRDVAQICVHLLKSVQHIWRAIAHVLKQML